MANTNSQLELAVITPDAGPINVTCDSVHLTVKDNKKGRGGGEYGIRPGHTKALLSLDSGRLYAFSEGKEVLSLLSEAGFARVDGNSVTVVVTHTDENHPR